MTNASDIIDALHQAGATLVVEDGTARLRGAQISDELKAAVKANRAAVLAEWERRQTAHTDRYAEVPTGEVALFARDLNLSRAQKLVVEAYATRQPRPVHAWVMRRSAEYHDLGVAMDDCDAAACVDLLCWQRNNSRREALDWLQGIDQCAKSVATDFPK